MKTEICRQYWRSLRSFSEARSAYRQTDSLPQRIVFSDLLAEATAADDLLLCWRGFFKRHAAFPVQFEHRSLENDGDIFPDEGRVRQGQIERGPDAKN